MQKVTTRDAIANLVDGFDATVVAVKFKDQRGLVAACRVCGCNDFENCPGGCHWIEEGLCSSH